MRLEFEPTTSVPPCVENVIISQSVSSEVERMLREGVRAAQDGDRVEARQLLTRVTEADENNENAWLWLASISEYPEELLGFLNNVLRVNPGNERALEWQKAAKSLIAKTFVQRGVEAGSGDRKEFARRCFEQAIEHQADNETAWLWLASVADSEDEKKACFEKVLGVNPENETALTALAAIQSQETQKLFQQALSAAFDGHHLAAQAMLETVLSQEPEFEDAWVLKSHLANSFEERSECFLKLRGLNPDNEMAKANLASWRMLAFKVVAPPTPEEAREPGEVTAEFTEENCDVAAEIVEAATVEEVLDASLVEDVLTEELSDESPAVEFSNHPAPEFFSESEPGQSADEVFADADAKNDVLEVGDQDWETAQPVEISLPQTYLAEEELPVEEYAGPDTPTQEWRFDSGFLPAPESVSAAQEPERDQIAEPTPEYLESEAAKNFFEEFQSPEVQFESDDRYEPRHEFSETHQHSAGELEAEESEMHLAFKELTEDTEPENNSHPAADESVLSEVQPESREMDAEIDDQTATPEPIDEDWKNTSPSVFLNYWPTLNENPLELDTAEDADDLQGEFSVAQPPVADQSAAEFSAPDEIVSDNSEMLAENNYLHQFAENTDQSFSDEESVESAELPVEETVSMLAAEVTETPKEDVHQPKGEPVLCPFCNELNEKQAFTCGSCQTVLTLSDLEMLLNQQDADQDKLSQTVASLESENESYGLDAERLTSLGIGHINLKNYRQGFFYLQEAVRMNPNNVLLDAQLNALAIRLAEIEDQQSVNGSMSRNCRILVVDDSPTVRKLIAGKLEKCGHEVICAIDGIDALEKMSEMVPDLILLDITMPRMDGYQVCKLIRSNDVTKEVPVIMISGKDGFFDKVRGKMAGTSGYITKPFGPETLMKTVESFLS